MTFAPNRYLIEEVSQNIQPFMTHDMMNCRNCNTMVNGNFCCHCGQPLQLSRIDVHYILHEIRHVLHFEKGILYTVKELLYRPGQGIKEFIKDDRSRLVKPMLFIVITSLVYTSINHLFHIEQEYIDYSSDTKNSTTSLIFNWIQNHYGYANIMMGVFIAFWLKLIYRAYGYNFFEILILLCFVMGMGMLVFSVFALFEGLTKLLVMEIAGVVGISYCAWAIGHFFDRKKVMSYLKALGAYVLGMITFFISVMLSGVLIDLFIKHFGA